MAPSDTPGAFPSLARLLRLVENAETVSNKKSQVEREHVDVSHVFDVKFYPYVQPDDEVVFAVVFIRSVIVIRLTQDAKDFVEVLAVFRDPNFSEYYDPVHDDKKGADRHLNNPVLADYTLNSVVWSQDITNGDPLLCFGGSMSGDIKVVNVENEKFLRNLSGHGGAINDLAISPLAPNILASASNDHSVRLWNLDEAYAHQPCAAILASPDAHKQAVLTIAFHGKGKYLLSAGHDTMINLWPVPNVPDGNAGTDRTTTVHFPLFSSTEVHSNYVDCVRWHGDLILSHAASSSQNDSNRPNSILLWRIDGFSSDDDVPENPPTAKPGVNTRSAFGGRFQRLLTFDMPNSGAIYMRFGLLNGPGLHPMLSMGNERSKFSFWDLQALEEAAAAPKDEEHESTASPAIDGAPASPAPTAAASPAPAVGSPSVRGAGRGRGRGGSARGGSRGGRGGAKSHHARFDVSDPFRPVPPHFQVTVPKYNFLVRQMAWSNCGSWAVGVGQLGIVAIFRRWGPKLGRGHDADVTMVDVTNPAAPIVTEEAMDVDPTPEPGAEVQVPDAQ